jgi:sugar phosphate isomerase/epimerase
MKYSSCITNPSIISQPFEKILNSFVEAGFDGIDIPGEKDLYPVDKIKPILDTYSNRIKIAELTAAINPNRFNQSRYKKERKRNRIYKILHRFCLQTWL